MNVLEVKNLTKKYNGFTLDNISFSVKEGSITGFLGVNGAGKTTTINSILGRIIPNHGTISILGREVNEKNETDVKNDIGIVYDNSTFYGHLTLKQMTKIVAPAYKQWDKDVYRNTLSAFDLDEKKKINDLSKGMKMKYSIALALSHHAKLLIMDEPTGGLDPQVRQDFSKLLAKLSKDNISIFYSTHITSDLEDIADHIIILNRGRIIVNDKVSQLKKAAMNEESIEQIMLRCIEEDHHEVNLTLS